jgi:hypothetical protein
MTSEPLRYTTTSGERRQNNYSGWQCRAVAGGSTGRARIGVCDFDLNPHAEPAILNAAGIPA